MPTTTEPAVGVVDHREFEARLADLFAHVGVPEAQAAGIAEILVLADLRGIESHGANFAPRYLRGLARGELNPAPKLEVVGGRGPDGRPTTDPELALGGSLLPIGGPKGSDLIVANELLAGALAGALFSFQISPALVMGADHHDRWSCGHFLLALDPSAFGAPGDF